MAFFKNARALRAAIVACGMVWLGPAGISVAGPAASTRGAPSKPTRDRWASRAWVAGQQGAVGRRTVSPTRTTSPRLAVPPGSGAGLKPVG